ncbi:carcinoembryonic antigen-related cell adhesion molecule 16-like protein [Cricetulus griseus]|nr:carcinoembryonic antigen-related cell adhesion molecule 16-like protein [Cricetulus griseus]
MSSLHYPIEGGSDIFQFLGILLPSIFLFLIEKNPGILTNLEEKAVKTSEDQLHGVFGEKSIYTVAQSQKLNLEAVLFEAGTAVSWAMLAYGGCSDVSCGE